MNSIRYFAIFLSFSFGASIASADPIDWGSRSNKISAFTILGGGILAGTGLLVGSTGSNSGGLSDALFGASEGVTTMAAGAAVAAAGAIGLVGNIVSDTLNDNKKAKTAAAEQRAVIQMSENILKNHDTGVVDSNFNSLLSVMECRSCQSDRQKAVLLAQLVLASDQVGRELYAQHQTSHSDYTQSADRIIVQRAQKTLGSETSAKNAGIALFLASNSIVNAAIENE
jgi:hypothetical protein